MAWQNGQALPDYSIIIGDSRNMERIPSESIQLVVTSPPYPMIEMWDELFSELDPRIKHYLASARQSDYNKAYELMHSHLTRTLEECKRVLSDGGTCCINIGDALRTCGKQFRLFPNHAKIIENLEKIGMSILPYILWKKPTNKPNAFLGSGFLPSNAYVTLDCEYIIISRKGSPRKFPPKDPKRYRSKFTKKDRDIWFSQIWGDIPGVNQNNVLNGKRTGAFPIEIPNRLISMFSIEDDLILDPFMGTGTTMFAAMQQKRRFVGYEIDEKMISRQAMELVQRKGEIIRVEP
ncbi:MAG: site-specific DNA-methyltransferase [Thermoplasmata archaeon]|nr:site-specific DNA-methyltransferase [Thermoplasmata archaeon]